MRWQLQFSALVLAAVTGCQSLGGLGPISGGGISVTEVAKATAQPSNVATVVTISEKGQPVTDLRAAAFKLSENGQPLDSKEIDLRLLEPTSVIAFQTVLLLDVDPSASKADKQQLSKAAATFVRSVRQRQPVTVFAFDGSKRLRLIGEFQTDVSGLEPKNFDKSLLIQSDPSRNLRGAVVSALDALDERLSKREQPIHVGSLVVFTRGPDVAGRVSQSEFEQRLDKAKHRVYLVAMGTESDQAEMTALSRSGKVEVSDIEKLGGAFEQAALLTSKVPDNYYVVSYCSPGRSGERTLNIDVEVVDDALEVKKGTLETRFDSNDFGPGCSSSSVPNFDAAKSASTN